MEGKVHKFDKSSVDLVIYHKGCSDGFGAAFAIWMTIGDQPKYQPCCFGDDIPDVTGKNVAICDFSFSKEIMLDMIQKAKSLIVIDHHLSAKNNLEDIPGEYKIFDMTHSGAYLTWSYFNPHSKIPDLILYIEDRDIWKHSLQNTQDFFARFKDVPFDFKEYERLLNPFEFKKIIEEGKIINSYDKRQMDWIICHANCQLSLLPNREVYNIVYLNSNLYKSDLGNKLLFKYQHVDFSVVYSYNDRKKITMFSLRSCNERTDVSEIAQLFGGGGHRNASGCVMNGCNCCLVPPITNYDLDVIYNNYIIDSFSIPTYPPSETNYVYSIITLNVSNDKEKIGKYLMRTVGKECDMAIMFHIDKQHNRTEFTVVFNKEFVKDNTLGEVDRVIEYFSNEDNLDKNKNNYKKFITFYKEGEITTI